jgi:uncharacterized membrane protein YcjF (UPF0283 family)
MDPRFWHFFNEHGLAVVICLTVISVVGLRSWMRASIAAQLVQLAESSLDQTQLEAVLTGLSGRHLVTPGLLEQYGRLSWGTRAGLLLLAIVGVSALGGAMQMSSHSNEWAQQTNMINQQTNMINMMNTELLRSVDTQLREAAQQRASEIPVEQCASDGQSVVSDEQCCDAHNETPSDVE